MENENGNMSIQNNTIGVSTEKLRLAADEAAACGKRLRYSSACLASDIDRLRESGTVQNELISRLKKQNDLLEAGIAKAEMMAAVLIRIAGEAELTESAVIDQEDSLANDDSKVDVQNLSGISELLDEVMKRV